MAKINNQAILQKVIDELGLYPGIEAVPTELADKILPVFQVNSEMIEVSPAVADVVRSISNPTFTGTTGTTIYTVPPASSGKFYLTNISLSWICEGTTTDHGHVYIKIVMDGSDIELIPLGVNMDTIGNSGALSLNLQNPIIVDAESTITLSSDTLISGMAGKPAATIIGYVK